MAKLGDLALIARFGRDWFGDNLKKIHWTPLFGGKKSVKWKFGEMEIRKITIYSTPEAHF